MRRLRIEWRLRSGDYCVAGGLMTAAVVVGDAAPGGVAGVPGAVAPGTLLRQSIAAAGQRIAQRLHSDMREAFAFGCVGTGVVVVAAAFADHRPFAGCGNCALLRFRWPRHCSRPQNLLY